MKELKRKFHRCGAGLTLIVTACCLLWSCKGNGPAGEPEPGANQAAGAEEPPEITNRLEIPPTVRRNLGITFANVEKRAVQQTRRVPGYFELRPEAIRDYHATVEGRVELMVTQFQQVKQGDTLFHLESPEWRTMQHELSEALNAIRNGEALVAVAHASIAESVQAAENLRQRIENLTEVQFRRADLEAELDRAKKTILRLEAELFAKQTALKTAQDHYTVMLNTAEALTGIQCDTLLSLSENSSGMTSSSSGTSESVPYWWTLRQLTQCALSDGIVDELAVTNGGWAKAGGLALRVVDPQMLRFYALAPQADIIHYQKDQPARIVPPQGASIGLQDDMTGRLQIGYRADPRQRTIPLYVIPEELSDWAAPGVSAYLEVVVGGDAQPRLAIPLSCVVRDGLNDIFFRRVPDNPDQVIRMDADLGVNDGRWVVVKSGVKAGDEIVLDGVYQLKLASSASGNSNIADGHFHADGTFHPADDK